MILARLTAMRKLRIFLAKELSIINLKIILSFLVFDKMTGYYYYNDKARST
jgi:hypothetical protein